MFGKLWQKEKLVHVPEKPNHPRPNCIVHKGYICTNADKETKLKPAQERDQWSVKCQEATAGHGRTSLHSQGFSVELNLCQSWVLLFGSLSLSPLVWSKECSYWSLMTWKNELKELEFGGLRRLNVWVREVRRGGSMVLSGGVWTWVPSSEQEEGGN